MEKQTKQNVMQEVKYPEPEYSKSNTSKKCPVCNGTMRYDTIRCPEDKKGCLVLHYGYRCLYCNRIFR